MLTAEEWIAGGTKPPRKISLADSYVAASRVGGGVKKGIGGVSKVVPSSQLNPSQSRPAPAAAAPAPAAAAAAPAAAPAADNSALIAAHKKEIEELKAAHAEEVNNTNLYGFY